MLHRTFGFRHHPLQNQAVDAHPLQHQKDLIPSVSKQPEKKNQSIKKLAQMCFFNFKEN